MKRFYCKHCKSEISPGFLLSDRKDGALMFDHYCPFCDHLLAGVPDFETPEQYKERTGQPWPDNGAVYLGIENDDVIDTAILSYRNARERIKAGGWRYQFDFSPAPKLHKIAYVVCATEAGPPPDGWRPEEER